MAKNAGSDAKRVSWGMRYMANEAGVHLRAGDVVGGGLEHFFLSSFKYMPQRNQDNEECPALVSLSANDSFLHALVFCNSKIGVMVLTSFLQCLEIN